MAKELKRPGNLPIREFARRAKKSRQQILLEIRSKKLLSLSLSGFPTHLPAWQLVGIKRKLTQYVIKHAPDVDNWTIYHALSLPREEFRGQSAVDVASFGNLTRVLAMVLSDFGF